MQDPPIETEIDEIEIDEMWHYIGKKRKVWIWLAINRSNHKTI